MRLKWLVLLMVLLSAAVPALAQDNAARHKVQQQSDTLFMISRTYNVCLDTLRAANPALSKYNEYEWLMVDEVIIPPAPPCYKTVAITSANPGASIPKVSRENNVCAEELFRNLAGGINNEFTVYIPLDAPLCYNEKHERLTYFDSNRQWLDEPVYTDVPVIAAPDDLMNSEYCAGDVYRANPQLSYVGYFAGMDLFMPDTVRQCSSTGIQGNTTLYALSLQLNRCMEDIQSANLYFNSWDSYQGLVVQIPKDAPRCYDDQGKRVNYHDKGVYTAVSGDSLFDVAKRFDVCVNDLKAANPFIYPGDMRLPEVMFIPDSAKCDNSAPVEYTVEQGDSLAILARDFNVCYNRIIQANTGNLHFESETAVSVVDGLEVGSTLKIPVNRPRCYTLEWNRPFEMVDYVCYAAPVDFTADYTGHEPAISPTNGTDSGLCYERSNTTPVIYENQKLTVYKIRPLDTAVTVASCFDLDPKTLTDANAVIYPTSVRPNDSWVIPEPYNHDCYLLTTDDETYYAREAEASYKTGYLDENGMYTVKYQDTLSGIGREFGYLPAWIAEANNLPDADMIYFRQVLKMPSYPSLYTIGKVAAIGGVPILVVLAGYGLVRLRRGGKRKRKNDDTTAA